MAASPTPPKASDTRADSGRRRTVRYQQGTRKVEPIRPHARRDTATAAQRQKPASAQSNTAKKAGGQAADAAVAAAGPEASAAYAAAKRIGAGARRGGSKASSAVSGGSTNDTRTLKVQFAFGLLLIFVLPFLRPNFFQNFNRWIARLLAWTLVYAVLLLLAGINPRTARMSAAFGWLPLFVMLLAPFGGTTPFGAAAISDTAARLSNQPRTGAQPSAFDGQAVLSAQLGPPNQPVA